MFKKFSQHVDKIDMGLCIYVVSLLPYNCVPLENNSNNTTTTTNVKETFIPRTGKTDR